jgi:uncharacterized membrane protein HdeD (DUF308 family)
LLTVGGLVSLGVGIVFLQHFHQAARPTTLTLSAFELFSGIIWSILAFRLRR